MKVPTVDETIIINVSTDDISYFCALFSLRYKSASKCCIADFGYLFYFSYFQITRCLIASYLVTKQILMKYLSVDI